MQKLFMTLLSLSFLAGCVMPDAQAGKPPAGTETHWRRDDPETVARRFLTVVDRVEPVAHSYCLAMRRDQNCDFGIYVDPDPRQPPNAGQTLDPEGKPAIIFTIALLAEAQNADELAFILGHEAAHHIRAHLTIARADARTGAVVFGAMAALGGADQGGIDRAQQMGAAFGARRFSKEHELQADALGARIAHAAGYDPLAGARYFERSLDPGNQFLGSHPPNADRIAVVRATMAEIAAGR